MKHKKLIIVILIMYAILWLLVRISFTGFHPGHSNSKEESIEDKLFLGEYELDKDTIQLKDGKKIYIPTPWIEKSWYLGMGILPRWIKKPSKGISILIEVKYDSSPEFWFKNREKKISSRYFISPLGAYKIHIDTIPHELDLYVAEDKKDGGQETMIVDKIKLRIKKNITTKTTSKKGF